MDESFPKFEKLQSIYWGLSVEYIFCQKYQNYFHYFFNYLMDFFNHC